MVPVQYRYLVLLVLGIAGRHIEVKRLPNQSRSKLVIFLSAWHGSGSGSGSGGTASQETGLDNNERKVYLVVHRHGELNGGICI